MASGVLTPPAAPIGQGPPKVPPTHINPDRPTGVNLGNQPRLRYAFNAHPLNFLQNHPGRVAWAQSILRNQGYHITVDGSMGPQTRAAAIAYRQGISGRHWSQNDKLSNTYRRPGDPPPTDPSSPPHTHTRPNNPPAKTGPESVPKAPDLTKMWTILHPARYAKLETNVQYRPILAQLLGQLNTQTAQGKQNLADLGLWYSQLNDQAKAATKADAANALAQQSAADTVRQNLLNAIGGGANPGAGVAAAFSGIMSGNQRELSQNQGAFDENRQATLVSQGASAQTQQLRMDQAKLDAINAQRSQALQQRAQQYNLNLQNAQILRNQQLAGLQAAEQQGFTNQLTRQTQARNLRGLDLQNQGLAAQLRKNGVGGNKGMAIMHDPGSRVKLHDSIYTQLVAPITSSKGKVFHPKEAWQQATALAHIATGKTPTTNKAVYSLVKDIYRQYVGQYVAYWNGSKSHANDQRSVGQYLSDSGTPWPTSVWHNRGASWA